MVRIVMIRHGKTRGNEEKRYVGRTDIPLSGNGLAEIQAKDYSRFGGVQRVFVSPMIRCRQSAQVYFPGVETEVVDDLKECDFGKFEYRNAEEMKDDPEYAGWIASGGGWRFPGGEDPEEFRKRVVRGMRIVLERCRQESLDTVGMAVHGGTIMAVMERLCTDRRDYYDWMVQNGCGYVVEADEECRLTLTDVIC